MANTFGGEFYPKGINSERSGSRDTLWLKLSPRELSLTNINARINHASSKPSTLEPMWFLMPSQIMLNVKHTWEDLASPMGVLKDIKSKISSQLDVARQTGGIGSIHQGYKADNPYLYVNTDRRSISLSLEFSVYSSTYHDVFLPTQTLIEHSCPEIIGRTSFDFPHIFSLQTWTGDRKTVDIISIRDVAITSVQPTYIGPWIDGYPSKATVEVDFDDLNPLYRSTLYNEQSKAITTRTRKPL